jgi:acyl-CoA dehydrogenase
MRTVGICQKALDMMCERALSRQTQGSLLADKQSVQNYVADSYAQLMQFRLFVLYVAWEIDEYQDYRRVRHDIAAIKVLTPQVLHDIVQRSIQVHGALGVSNEMPLGRMWMMAPIMGLVDGPSEVHRVTVARQVLKRYQAAPGLWPTEHLPEKIAAAREKFAEYLELEVANL